MTEEKDQNVYLFIFSITIIIFSFTCFPSQAGDGPWSVVLSVCAFSVTVYMATQVQKVYYKTCCGWGSRGAEGFRDGMRVRYVGWAEGEVLREGAREDLVVGTSDGGGKECITTVKGRIQ